MIDREDGSRQDHRYFVRESLRPEQKSKLLEFKKFLISSDQNVVYWQGVQFERAVDCLEGRKPMTAPWRNYIAKHWDQILAVYPYIEPLQWKVTITSQNINLRKV